MKRFADKIILVTGGTQGMGFTTAVAFAREGGLVCISGRDEQKGSAAAEQIGQLGGKAHYFGCDIADKVAVKSMIDRIVDRFGRLDCAFNNAGISSQTAPLAESSEADWDRVIDVNVNGTYYCMKYECQQMLRQGGGSIVNNSSIAGLVPRAAKAAYVTSKAAVIGLTRCAAIDHAQQNIRVNAIAAGPIAGGMNSEEALLAEPERTQVKVSSVAMLRFGRPEEVAHAVLWLCSDEASYVTGITMPVDGGWQAGKWR